MTAHNIGIAADYPCNRPARATDGAAETLNLYIGIVDRAIGLAHGDLLPLALSDDGA